MKDGYIDINMVEFNYWLKHMTIGLHMNNIDLRRKEYYPNGTIRWTRYIW